MKSTNLDGEATEANATKSIWIPCFSNSLENSFNISYNNQSESEQNLIFQEELKQTIIENDEATEQKNIKNIKQSFNTIFRFDSHYINNPNTKPKDKDILIKDSFLISIINLDILADSHISTVFLSKVDQDSWVKSG